MLNSKEVSLPVGGENSLISESK